MNPKEFYLGLITAQLISDFNFHAERAIDLDGEALDLLISRARLIADKLCSVLEPTKVQKSPHTALINCQVGVVGRVEGNRWIPVGESLPLDGKLVLGLNVNDDDILILPCFFAEGEWLNADTECSLLPNSPITYWLPLPPLPVTTRQ